MRLADRTAALFLVALATVLSGPGLSAQDTDAWARLGEIGLTTVYVLDETGADREGVIRRVGADSLVILGLNGADMHLSRSEIRRVAKRGDSFRNGALIGGGVGLLGTLPVLLEPCTSFEEDGGCVPVKIAFTGFAVGLYALIGAGIDAMRVGRTTIYERPDPAGRAVLFVRPGDGWTLTARFQIR